MLYGLCMNTFVTWRNMGADIKDSSGKQQEEKKGKREEKKEGRERNQLTLSHPTEKLGISFGDN